MARGSSKDTDRAEFHISNSNLRLKREIVNIAKSKGLTYSQFCRQELIRIAASYPDAARNYNEDHC